MKILKQQDKYMRRLFPESDSIKLYGKRYENIFRLVQPGSSAGVESGKINGNYIFCPEYSIYLVDKLYVLYLYYDHTYDGDRLGKQHFFLPCRTLDEAHAKMGYMSEHGLLSWETLFMEHATALSPVFSRYDKNDKVHGSVSNCNPGYVIAVCEANE